MLHWKFNILISIFIVFTMCTQPEDQDSVGITEMNEKDSINNVIVKKHEDTIMFGLKADTSLIAVINSQNSVDYKFPGSTPTKLNNAELDTIENILRKCIGLYNNDVPEYYFAIGNLEEYHRQYIPVINPDGEKEVWINCFCSDEHEYFDWKNEIIGVDDGGSCYFNVIVNLTDKSWRALEVNGAA